MTTFNIIALNLVYFTGQYSIAFDTSPIVVYRSISSLSTSPTSQVTSSSFFNSVLFRCLISAQLPAQFISLPICLLIYLSALRFPIYPPCRVQRHQTHRPRPAPGRLPQDVPGAVPHLHLVFQPADRQRPLRTSSEMVPVQESRASVRRGEAGVSDVPHAGDQVHEWVDRQRWVGVVRVDRWVGYDVDVCDCRSDVFDVWRMYRH